MEFFITLLVLWIFSISVHLYLYLFVGYKNLVVNYKESGEYEIGTNGIMTLLAFIIGFITFPLFILLLFKISK